MERLKHPIYNAIERMSNKIDDVLYVLKRSRRPENIILDNEQAAKILNISTDTLKRWQQRGLISYSKVKNKTYCKLSDINELIDSNYVKKK
jgi:hypothetical protein